MFASNVNQFSNPLVPVNNEWATTHSNNIGVEIQKNYVEKIVREEQFEKSRVEVIFDILSIVTIIPYLVTKVIAWKKQNLSSSIVYELQQLKWRGLVESQSIDYLTTLVDDEKKLAQALSAFIQNLPKNEISDTVKEKIKKSLKNEKCADALRELKQYLQIKDFYNKHTIAQLKNSNQKIQNIFKQANRYMHPELTKLCPDVKHLYKRVIKVQSEGAVEGWLKSLESRGEITTQERQQSAMNLEELISLAERKIKAKELANPNMDLYFWKEMHALLCQARKKGGMRIVGRDLMPLVYYQKFHSQLSKLDPNDPNNIQALRQLEWEINRSVCLDLFNAPSLDYHFRAQVGILRKKLRQTNDLLAQNKGHDACGCHFSYDKKNPKMSPTPKQVLNVSKLPGFPQPILSEGNKADVMVLTCSLGEGHNQTAHAIAKYIGTQGAHLNVTDLSKDLFLEVDGIHRIARFFGKNWSLVDGLKFIVQHQWTTLLKVIVAIANVLRPFQPRDTVKEGLLRKRLLLEMPDQLITAYHMDLPVINEVAKEMGLPLTHMVTDYDAKMKECFSAEPDHPHFNVLSPEVVEKVPVTPVNHSKVYPCSGPLRPEFFQSTPAEQLEAMRKERKIDPDTKTVLFMSGGWGLNVSYPEMLAKSTTLEGKYHLIVVAGKNNAFITTLEESVQRGEFVKEGVFFVNSSGNVRIEVAQDPENQNQQFSFFVGPKFLNGIYDLSDCVFCRPSGLTLMEALNKGKKILFDLRQGCIPWEKPNIDYGTEFGAVCNTSIENIEKDLIQVLETVQAKKKISLPSTPKVLQSVMQQVSEQEWSQNKFNLYRPAKGLIQY